MAGDDFYVGYLERAPVETKRHLRRVVIAALALALGVGAAAAALQPTFAAKTFEFGSEREFVGWVHAAPIPRLVVAAPADAGEDVLLLSYPLAHAGTKFGAESLVAEYDGTLVRLRGWLIYRGPDTMIDVVPESIQAALGEGREFAKTAATELGERTLSGRILDSKCHFGVMNPGSGKVHRACAVRCISSGTPPVLALRDAEGRTRHLLLVGADGRALNREILDLVADNVEVRGRVTRLDRLFVLWTEPDRIRRL